MRAAFVFNVLSALYEPSENTLLRLCFSFYFFADFVTLTRKFSMTPLSQWPWYLTECFSLIRLEKILEQAFAGKKSIFTAEPPLKIGKFYYQIGHFQIYYLRALPQSTVNWKKRNLISWCCFLRIMGSWERFLDSQKCGEKKAFFLRVESLFI